MKKRRFPILLIFLFVLTLLFGGCNADSYTFINSDGTKLEVDLNSGEVSLGESDLSDPAYHVPVEDYINMTNQQNSAVNNGGAVTDEDNAEDVSDDTDLQEDAGLTVSEDGEYTSKEEVALYIHLYNHLPGNYITKKEAQDLGWDSSKGNLNTVAPGKSIGGDKFGNREELLPKKEGRVYYECDIDYKKGSRNAKRIVFSNDGLIYYTEDHYETYELLYGSE
ncbi:ribonuclease [Lachnospiraceae bacterium G41]|nr:ribonuclease [Lachnospiraceae bacterium G41]